MPRKKVVKEPLEKVKDEVVLEIIEDSSDEDGDTPLTPNPKALPPPPEDNAIRVSKGNEVISQMSVDDIKQELKTPKPRKKRVLTEEQKAKMKAGREKRKAEKALQAGKKVSPVPVELKAEPTPPLAPIVNEEEPPRWFKAYLATQKKVEPESVKKEAPVKKARGRPKGKKDSQPRVKKQSTVSPEEVILPAPKLSMRFI